MENGVSIHIVYNYITIVIIVMFIGHFLFQRNMKYCILIGSIFLSISLLGQLLSSIFLYPYSGNRVLAEFEYSNAIVHAFQGFRAPFSGKIVHIFPEQSAAFN